MTRTARLLVTAVVTALGLVLLAPASPAGAAHCGTTWGSLAKSAPADERVLHAVTGVRSGRHACFDRLVIDLGGRRGDVNGFDVRYVPVVRQDGSGARVPVRGAADLQVVTYEPAYNSRGEATIRLRNRSEVVDVSGYRTFRQVAWAGSFEGQTTLALGVRARLPFRASTIPASSGQGPRLVIDVAHTW